jgi:PAS domain S-box-containing protein
MAPPLADLLEHIADGLFALDAQWRLTFINGPAARFTGREPAALLGRHVWSECPDTFGGDFREACERAARERRVVVAVVRHAGSGRWVECRISPAPDDGGLYVCCTDVTARQRAQDAHARAEAHYRRLADTAPYAIYALDAAGHFVEVNPAARRLLGLPDATALGRHFLEVLHPDDHARASAAFGALLSREAQDLEIELRAQRPDGTVRDLSVTCTAILEGGQVAGVHGIARDVTDQLRLAEELRQAQKMEAVGRLAGGIAHDFNNLLTALKGHAGLVLDELPPNHPVRPDVEEMDRAADRAAGLTRQLLAFSRRQVLSPRLFDVRDTLSGVERMLRRLIGEDVELSVRLAEGPLVVRADPGQLEQVLLNLVVNARDAMPRGGRLEVEAGRHRAEAPEPRAGFRLPAGDYVALRVRDTGVGMDAATRARIFEPFFTTKGVGEGTGLGLSTAYGIVKQSGGFIDVASEPGRGAAFTVYLPRLAQEAEAARARAPGAPALPRGKGGTVLLVEDDAAVRAMTTRALESAGYRVLVARHGVEALRLAGEHPGRVDLLLTDVVMPGMSGREVASRLREARADLAVLFMSGYTGDAVERHGVPGLGSHFLAKPFTPRELVARTSRLLEAPPAAPAH